MQCVAASGDITIATGKTIIGVVGTSARSPRLLQVVIACSDTAGDSTNIFAIRHFTAAGTAGSSGTPLAANRNFGAPSCTVGLGAYSVEPTFDTGDFIDIPLNQRGLYTWFAPTPSDFVAKAGSTNGWAVVCVTASSGLKHRVTVIWDE